MMAKDCKFKLAISLLFLLTIFSVVAFCGVVWMAYVPVKVIEFQEPLAIVNEKGEFLSSVKPGEVLYYRIKYRKYKNIPCTIVAQLVNKYTLQFPVYESNLKVTDKEKLKDPNYWDVAIAQLPFPETAMEGEHFLNVGFSYRVNPLRIEVVSVHSNSFNVIGGIPHRKDVPLAIWTIS